MSDGETFVLVVGVYPDLVPARRDFQAVRDLYYETNSMDAFDIAVVGKQDTGKIKIFRKYEQPTEYGELLGPGWGLATGLAVALYPGAPFGSGFLTGDAPAVVGINAIVAHVARVLSRDDLREIGELLDPAPAGLIVAAETGVGTDVRQVMAEAEQVRPWEIDLDREGLNHDIRDAYRQATA